MADDSPLVLRMLEGMLSQAGYGVLTARDGLEAAEKAFASEPDLIVLDVMMPRLGGYQACRLLKSEPETRHIPVVLLTSKDQAGDRFWGLQTGADRYVTKDEAPQTIVSVIQELLARHERGDKVAGAGRRTGVDILSRVNDLLDRKLYEATLLSEIGRVARSLGSFDETISSVMGLVARVVDYQVAALSFLDEDDLHIVLTPRGEMPSAVTDEVRRRVVEQVHRAREGMPLGSIRSQVVTLPEGDRLEVPQNGLDDVAFFEVMNDARLAGSLALGGGRAVARLTAETRGLMGLVANQAFIVVENARLIERLRHLSIRDGLTELFNHRHAMELLGGEFQRVGRYQEAVSLLMVDIDHFKRVNDTYGHQTGDMILREVARLLAGSLRNVDAVARYGGEEFAVILPHTGYEEARSTADRLRAVVADHRFRGPAADMQVTVSVGVAAYPGPEILAPSDLVRAADQALYRAKSAGRNRVE